MSGRGRCPRRRYALVAALALVGLLGAGCAATTAPSAMTLVPVAGGTLTVGIDQQPTGCNPGTPAGDTWADLFVLEAVLPSAFVTAANGQVIPNQNLVAGAEVTSVKPQTVVYTLNPSAVWSDGVPITARDFAYAWRQGRATDGSSADVAGYRDITSVTGSDHGHTVTVVFSDHYADWRMLFSYLMPAHVLQRVGWNPPCHGLDPAVDLSGGPFALHAVTPTSVDLVANRRWWGKPPELAALRVRVARDGAQLADWIADGTAQVVQPSAFSAAEMAGLSAQPDVTTSVEPSTTFLQLVFSTTGPVTGSVAVRQALAHLVDRQALVDQVVGWADSAIVPAASHLYAQGQGPYPGQRAPSQLPNALDAGNETTTTTATAPSSPARPFPTTASVPEADRLLTSAGYLPSGTGGWIDPLGSALSVRLAVDTADRWAATTAPLLVRQLDRVGVPVTTVHEPSEAAAGAALGDGAADLALLPFTATPYPSTAVAWYTTLLGAPGENGSADWSHFTSPSLDTLLTRGAAELNPVTGSADYQAADRVLWDQMVSLPLFAEPFLLAVRDSVSGVGPNPNGPGLLWFPQTWQLQALRPTSETTQRA